MSLLSKVEADLVTATVLDLVELLHAVADAIASKSGPDVDRATVAAADVAADVIERERFGAKTP